MDGQREVDLLAMIVGKILRDEHGFDDAPHADAYRIVTVGQYGEGRPDVQVDVDLGRGLVCRVVERWFGEDGGPHLDAIVETGREIADAMIELSGNSEQIRGMLQEVKAATKRQISKANRQGLTYRLISVTPSPTGSGFDDTVVEVRLEALAEFLRPREFRFDAECSDDVTEVFEQIRGEQEAREAHLADLARVGAAGRIDTVFLAAIRAAGIDDETLLTALRDTDEMVIDLTGDAGQRFTLYWEDGVVSSRGMELAEGVRWFSDKLVFDEAPRDLSKGLEGRPATEVFKHPAITDAVTVSMASGRKGEYGQFHCSRPLAIFGYESGRIAA